MFPTLNEQDTERTLSGSLNRMKDQILAVDDLIAAEERKLSRDIEAERRPHRLAIERSNEEISELNVRITETRHAAQDIEEEQGKALQKYEDVKSRILNAQHLEGEARDRLANVQQVQSRPINAYGPLAWRVEEAVNRERRWHEKPIGPIGQLLKLNESQYASCLESFFHASLNGWIVTNEHDLKLMNSIKGQLRLFVFFFPSIFSSQVEADLLQSLQRQELPHLPPAIRQHLRPPRCRAAS